MISSLFYHHNSFCTVFSVASFSLSINMVVLYHYSQSRVLKTWSWSMIFMRRKLKVENCDYVFRSFTTFQRRKELILESRCRQVSVHLQVFGEFFCPLFKPFHNYSLCLICILLQLAFYSQFVVCILHSVCILLLVRSPLVRSLCFTLTD